MRKVGAEAEEASQWYKAHTGEYSICFEFVRQLLDNYGKGLLGLKRKHTDPFTLMHLDVIDESSISVVTKTYTETHG